MLRKYLVGILMIMVSVTAYAFHVMLIFPLNSITNMSYEISFLLGNFFFFFGGTIVLFISYFLSAILLSKFKFYQGIWIGIYAVISVAITLLLFQTEVYNDSILLWALKYVDHSVPGLAVILAWKMESMG